jgi:autotransporter-associated beta strand protein
VLTLSGTNPYTGTTTIDSGKTLRVGGANAIGTGEVTVSGTLDLNGYTVTVGELTGTGTVNSSAGAATINVGHNITQSFSFSGTITDGSGTVALTKEGTGTFTLSGSNSYSGDTTISAGTLKLGSASTVPSGSGKGDIIVSGTLDLNGYSPTVNGLSGTGNVTSGVAHLPARSKMVRERSPSPRPAPGL